MPNVIFLGLLPYRLLKYQQKPIKALLSVYILQHKVWLELTHRRLKSYRVPINHRAQSQGEQGANCLPTQIVQYLNPSVLGWKKNCSFIFDLIFKSCR